MTWRPQVANVRLVRTCLTQHTRSCIGGAWCVGAFPMARAHGRATGRRFVAPPRGTVFVAGYALVSARSAATCDEFLQSMLRGTADEEDQFAIAAR